MAVIPQIPLYNAGIGISETGQGYYYGGWISNASMHGWTGNRTISKSFYRFEYNSNRTIVVNSPDALPKAEGAII